MRNSQPAPATGAAVALDDALAVGVVVVGQLFARRDVLAGTNPDVVADNLAVAVRLARVVDEPRDVAIDHGVADPPAIHGEAPDLAALQILRLALETFLVIDQLAFVFDDARVLVDWLEREHAPAMHLRTSTNDARQLRIMRHADNRITGPDGIIGRT